MLEPCFGKSWIHIGFSSILSVSYIRMAVFAKIGIQVISALYQGSCDIQVWPGLYVSTLLN